MRPAQNVSDILAQASSFGKELDDHRKAMASAMDHTAQNLSVMLEAKADADAARATCEAACFERDAAVSDAHALRERCIALEHVAKDERIAHAEAQMLVAQLRDELTSLRHDFSALSLHMDSHVAEPQDAARPPARSPASASPSPSRSVA